MRRRDLGIALALLLAGCQSPPPPQASTSKKPIKRSPSEAPGPPARGSELLHVFLSKDFLAPGKSEEVALAVVVGRRQHVARGVLTPSTLVAKQQARLRSFARELKRPGPADALRKRMLAWVQCVCTFNTKCQGGWDPCVRCSTCTSMGSHGTRPARKRWRTWPKAKPGTRAPMGLMSKGCPAKNVCLLVDVSGSMDDEQKLERVKSAIKESLRHYMAGDVFSLIAFSGRPELIVAPTELKVDLRGLMTSKVPRLMSSKAPVDALIKRKPTTGPEKTLRMFLDRIDTLKAGGRTNIDAALRLAAETLQITGAQEGHLKNPQAINRILLFSDGMHLGRRVTRGELARFRALARRIVAKGVSISTFGVGKQGFDEDLLSVLVDPSLRHSGRYYYVRDLGSVRKLLWEDLMVIPRATRVRVRVVLRNGVEALSVGQGGFWNRKNKGPIHGNLQTIASGSKRTLALKLKVTPRARELATVELIYRDTQGVLRVERRTARVKRASTSDVPLTRKNLVALEELLIQESRDALAKAVERLDRGDARGARRALLEQVTRLSRYEK